QGPRLVDRGSAISDHDIGADVLVEGRLAVCTMSGVRRDDDVELGLGEQSEDVAAVPPRGRLRVAALRSLAAPPVGWRPHDPDPLITFRWVDLAVEDGVELRV